MDLRIIGTILIIGAMVCGTWYAVTVRKIKADADSRARHERYAHNEKIANDASLAAYQETNALLTDARTKIAIRDEQIKRRDKEIERLKKLLDGVSFSPFDKEAEA